MNPTEAAATDRLAHSRRLSEQLVEWVRGKGHVLIVTHDNPDPDSLAAAVGLQMLLLWKTGQEATIAYGGMIGRGENRVMVEQLEITCQHLDQIQPEDFQVICLIDTQPGTGNNSWPSDRPVHLVIDHHPLRPATEACCFYDVRDKFGAAATILYEYLRAQEINISVRLATCLFYAIKSETQDLGREWARADRDAYLALLPLANNRILYDITHPQVPASYFTAFSRALENTRVYGKVLVFNLFDVEHADIVAELADFLLRWDGVEHVLGMGNHQGMGVFSFRTRQLEVRAERVIGTVLEGIGTSGGHGLMAGGQIHGASAAREDQLNLERRLTRRLLKALDVPMDLANPLLAE